MTIKAQNYIEFTYNKNKKKKEIADKAKKAVNDYIQKANGNIGKPVYLPEVNRNWENEIDNMVAGSGSGNEKKDICSKANEILALVFKEWQEAATKAAKSEETKTAETTFETEAEGSKAAISASATEIEKIIDDFQKTTLSDSFLFQTPADHENFQKKLVEHLPKPESYVAPTAGSDAERDWEAILGKLGKQGASKEEIERYLETAEKAARADNLKGKLAVAESKLRNETDWESWETEEEIRGWIRKIKDKLSKIETSEETETTAETSGEGSGRSVEKEWKDLSEEWFNTDQTDNSKLEVVFEKIKKYYSEMQAEDQEKYKEEWEDYDFSFLLCKAINFTREAEDSEEREKIGELIRQIEEIGAKISTDRYWGMNNLDTRLVALKEKYEKLEKETEKVETSGETSKHSETETPPVKEKEADTIVLTEEKLPEGDFTKKQLTKLYIKISDEILGLEEDGNEKIKVKLGRLEVLRQNWYVKGDPLITLTEKQLIEKSTKVQEEIERLKTKLLTEQETEWADEVPRELKKLREEWIKEIIPTSPEKLTEYKKIIFDDFPHYKGEFKLEEPNPDDSDEEEIEPEPEGYTKWRENYRNEHLKEWDLPALEKRLTDNYDKYKDLKKEVADILKINKYDEVNQHFSSKHYETLSKVIPAPIAATTAEIEEYKDMWGGSWGVIESNVYEAFDETELRNKLDWLKKEDYIARNQDKLNDWEKALVREKGVGVHTSTIQKWEEILPTAEFSKEFRKYEKLISPRRKELLNTSRRI